VKSSVRSMVADLSLIFIAMIWGFSFTTIKVSIGMIPPMEFIGVRFVIASAVLAILFYKHLLRTNRYEIMAGCVIGIFLFLGYCTQTIGLQYTTPGKSGFITGIYIVLVPFLASIIQKKSVGALPITGAVIAVTGLGLLSVNLNELYLLGEGDFLTLICSVGFALHILCVERYSPKYDPFVLTIVQIAFTGVLSLIYSGLFETFQPGIPGQVWQAILFTALLSTCFAFLAQNIAQKFTSSSHTALLLGLESPFALLFSILLWGESPTLRGYIGCLLIFAAILLVEMGPMLFRKKAGEITGAEMCEKG